MKAEDKKIIEMSGQFLIEHLPNDFQDWDDEELYDWVEQKAWLPYNSWSGKELLNQIINCARVK